ncbi:hypothetical protein L0F63_000602 [Massospora cicadina]|nr:hypothetical protein L0F63_000602 [Massospora cicadina]
MPNNSTANGSSDARIVSPVSHASTDADDASLTGRSSTSQSANLGRASASAFDSDPPIKTKSSSFYTNLVNNPFFAIPETRRRMKPIGGHASKVPESPRFVFSYDCFKRVPAASEAIKRLEEEVNKGLKEYYTAALSNPFPLGGTVAGANTSDPNTLIFPTETSAITALNQTFKSGVIGAQTTIGYGSRLGALFNVTAAPSQRVGSQAYSKANANLQSVLSKHHRRVNGFLPLRRRLLAFLFLPFATRPLDETNCRLSITAVQNLLAEFPVDTPEQLTQLINWCLAALGNPNAAIRELLLEKLQFLVGQGIRQPNLLLDKLSLEVMASLLIHHRGLLEITCRVDVALQETLNGLLNKFTARRDTLTKYAAGGSVSYLHALAHTLHSPNPILHQSALRMLGKMAWPPMGEPAAWPFYQGFVLAGYGIMVSYASQPNLLDDAVVPSLLALLRLYYAPSQRAHAWVDGATWHLVVRCTLLAFGMGAAACSSSSVSNLSRWSQVIHESRAFLRRVMDSGGEALVVASVRWLLSEWDLLGAIAIYSQITLEVLDHAAAERLLGATLPALYDRYSQQPGSGVPDPLERFLLAVKAAHLHVVYAPLIGLLPTQDPRDACRLWRWLQLLTTVLTGPNLFFADLDLVATVLFSPMGPRKPYALGQVVFLSHVVLAIRRLRQASESQPLDHLHPLKLLVELERRLGTILNARRRLQQPELHPVLRHLVVQILSEIRQCALSRKRPGWLGVVLGWSEEMLAADLTSALGEMAAIDRLMALQLARPPPLPGVFHRSDDLPALPFLRSDHRSGDLSVPPTSVAFSERGLSAATRLFDPHQHPPILLLLATVYSHIAESELTALLPHLWRYGLCRGDGCPQAQLLLLLTAERIGPHVDAFLRAQQLEPGGAQPPQTLEVVTWLFEARRSLLRHLAVVDPSERPFRRAGPSLAFVSTTVGTFEPVLQESRWLEKLKLAGTPLDEIKMVQSLGWDAEEEEIGDLLSDYQRLRNRPVTLFSSAFDEIFTAESQGCFPTAPPRKKPLLTPLMGTALLDLTCQLGAAPDPQRAFRAELLLNVMRDEPTWFLRLLLNGIEELRGEPLTSRLNQVAHLVDLRPKLPLQFAYHAFNYLAGWLKHLFRDQRCGELGIAAMAVPLLARLLPSSHEVTLRELRKAKLDTAFICGARLLLQEPTSFFRIPYSRIVAALKEGPDAVPHIPQALLDLGLLRISQCLFTARLLQRAPHDASPLARNLTNFEPMAWYFSRGEGGSLLQGATLHHASFSSLSALHSHAWMTFLEGVFSHLDGDYQDRNGLQVLLEGVNRILLTHLSDFTVVGRAVRLLVRVVLQFRRLFNLKSGYALFIEALFQAYFTARDPRIRDGILYAVALFFNLHQESFMFQMLGSLIPPMLNQPVLDGQAYPMSQALYEWFVAVEDTPGNDAFNLMGAIAAFPKPKPILLPEDGGGLGSFLARRAKPLHHEGSITHFKHLSVANTLRLLVTVIAYDPGSLRSEQFVATLRRLLPYLLKSVTASALVDFAIQSIIPVFVRFSKRRSRLDALLNRLRLLRRAPDDEPVVRDVASHYGHDWPHNDGIQIRIELFRLVGVLLQLGGDLLPAQHDALGYVLGSVVRANVSAGAPLEAFVREVILPTRDSASRTNLGFKTLLSLAGGLASVTRPAAVADILRGASLLAAALGGNCCGPSESAQFDDLLQSYLAFGCRAFLALAPEGAHQVGPALGSLFCVLVQNLPRAALQELRSLSPTTACLGYLLVPLCASLPLDDAFIFKPTQLDAPVKVIAQHVWALLLERLSSPVVASTAPSARQPPGEHPLAASLDFLLGLVGVRLVMQRAHRLLFMDISAVTYQTAQLLQTHVFDPLLHSHHSRVPSPVRLHAAWRLITFWESTRHSTFFPLFSRTHHRLLKLKPPIDSAHTSDQNVSLTVPTSNRLSPSPEPDPAGAESGPTGHEPNVRGSRKGTRVDTRLGPAGAWDPNGGWDGVSINRVIAQLERFTFALQTGGIATRRPSFASNSASDSSGPTSPRLGFQEPHCGAGDSLAVPGPSRVSFASSVPLAGIQSFTGELEFYLAAFGFPPSGSDLVQV